MTDGNLWAFLRLTLMRGAAIYADHKDASYETLSAALDTRASALTDELRKLMGVPVDDEDLQAVFTEFSPVELGESGA